MSRIVCFNTDNNVEVCKKCEHLKICDHVSFKNSILSDSNKAGSKYIDRPLEKPNTIEFGVMKKYKEYSVEEQISYIRKELIELENYTDVENMIEEAFDVAQSAFTLLKILEHKKGIIIKVENKRHLKKLSERGYIK